MKALIAISLATSFFIATNAYADGNIKGSVFRKGSAEPLDFVTVTLVNADTGTPLQIGAMTDENGNFIIANAPAGKYIVRISMVGNIPQEREVTIADSEINQKNQLSVSTERRVFNVSSNIAATGASAEELLAAVPSVDVNSDGDISLRGNSDVLVWINGKAMGMNADNRSQFLRQIPAETIESIEVMTNPSSKHSTEGTAGIISA